MLTEDEKDLSAIALSIKEPWQKASFSPRDDAIALCVNTPQTFVRPISLPVLPEGELNAAVEFELSQSFPGSEKPM